ncbi:MAG: hypothetical protein U0556_18085 [Dehalococcoidia bacterium]
MLYSREERQLLSKGEIARKAAGRLWRTIVPPRFGDLQALIDAYGEGGTAPATLFLGDSVFGRISRNDRDRRSLGEMLAGAAGDGLAIGRPAYHPGLFLAFVEALLALPRRPRTLVLAINLRCFSPQWDRHPGWQFDREIAALRRFAVRPTSRAPRLRETTASPAALRTYDAEPVDYLGGDYSTIGGYRRLIATRPSDEAGQRKRRAQIFVYHYLFALASDHHHLDSLGGLIRLARDAELPLSLYLTPINIEGGVSLAGAPFAVRLAENAATLRAALDPLLPTASQPIADFSTLVGADGFLYREDPTEHLNETGREALVNAVTALLAQRGTVVAGSQRA